MKWLTRSFLPLLLALLLCSAGFAEQVTDGGAAWEKLTPTPGFSNDGAERISEPLEQTVAFSEAEGFRAEGFRLRLTTEPGYLAEYTSSPQIITYQRRFLNAVHNTADKS